VNSTTPGFEDTVLQKLNVFASESHTYLYAYAYLEEVFAECALGRTFTAPFKCRVQNRAMNTCMVAHATQDEQDAAREEWFATRLKRQRDRESKEKRRIEQEKFHREWWGLPVEEREGKKGREVLKNAERVGGFPNRDEGQLSKDRHR
jgi:COX assembly protein 1